MRAILIITLIGLVGCGGEFNPTIETSDTTQLSVSPQFDALRSAYYDYLVRNQIKGGQISFFSGDTFYSQAYGDAKTDELLRIASCSKIITAAGVLKAESMGLLNTEDKMIDYFQPIGTQVDEISIGNLLNHSSGWDREKMPYYPLSKQSFDSVVENYGSLTVENLFMKYSNFFQYETGSKQAYSSMSYVFLSHIIEKSSGMTYQDFINRNISDKLVLDEKLDFIKGTAGWLTSSHEYLKILASLYEDPTYQKLWEVPEFVTASMKDYVFTHGARAVEIDGHKAFICEGYLEGNTAYGVILEGGTVGAMAIMKGGNDLSELKELINRFIR